MTELKLKKLIQAVAYYAVMFLAVALFIKILNWGVLNDLAGVLEVIANALAYILIAISALFYVKTKRNVLYMITYIASVVLIVIFVIIPLF